MKIIIYTVTDCQFSKQEKEYLSSHGLQFEEKNLETNRELLTEMLAVGNNFAGTPLTKIEKDDGQIAVLKGFTPAEFDKTLGFAQPESTDKTKPPEVVPQPGQIPVVTPPTETAPGIPTPVSPAPTEQPTVGAPPAPMPETPPPSVTTADPAFTSILNNLEQQAQAPASPVPPVVPTPPAPTAGQPPTIPDPQF